MTNVTDTDIDREGTMQVQQALQQQVPGIIISDAAGNPLRAEVSYRGFDASPVNGRSQGIAVYQNGVRINEAFGDTVKWDVIPSNAIASVSVVSNNPSFGLNALGGAISILMKDGFTYQGAEIDVMGGSFGRAQIGVQAGGSSGNASVYVAGEAMKDDSFRDFSESEVKRFYGDIGLKGSLAESHFSLTAAKNEFGASAAAPIELLERDWSNTFTTPQTTNLEVFMPTISGTVKATNTLTVSALGYYRDYKNSVVDGNVTELEECDDDNGTPGDLTDDVERFCPEDSDNFIRDAVTGELLEADDFEEPLGTIDRLNTKSESWVLQSKDKRSRRCLGARTCSSRAHPTTTAARTTRHRANSGKFSPNTWFRGLASPSLTMMATLLPTTISRSAPAIWTPKIPTGASTSRMLST